MTTNAHKTIINTKPFASTEHVLAVIPPMMYSMIASPYEVDMQEYITDGLNYPSYDKMRFNVLFLPSIQRPQLTEEHTTHGRHTAYIILRGADIHHNHIEPGTDAYFDNAVVYTENTPESKLKRNLVELYDLVAHEIIHVEIETLLRIAFEHRTMRLRELYETFFHKDSHIYGEYFNKDAAQRALSWAFFHGDTDPYPVEIIASYAGITITQDVLEKAETTQAKLPETQTPAPQAITLDAQTLRDEIDYRLNHGVIDPAIAETVRNTDDAVLNVAINRAVDDGFWHAFDEVCAKAIDAVAKAAAEDSTATDSTATQ